MAEVSDFTADVVNRALTTLASTLPKALHERLVALARNGRLLESDEIAKAIAAEADEKDHCAN